MNESPDVSSMRESTREMLAFFATFQGIVLDTMNENPIPPPKTQQENEIFTIIALAKSEIQAAVVNAQVAITKTSP